MKYDVKLLVLLLSTVNVFGQTNLDHFKVPITIPLKVSGSFGELRPNHFHSGIDFTSNYKIGDPVFAPEDGVVNRIKVSSFGYGKALYLKHPNGYTTVYGHLNAYLQKIDTYVKDKQYTAKQFEIELFPLATELVVKKGDIIGYIGNTGGSGGPHLHYEFRDTNTEEIINPLTLSLLNDVVDIEQPIINSLFVYPLTKETVVNNETTFFEVALNKRNNKYLSNTILTNGSIGFGINTHDTQNGSRGKNGVYRITTYLNGSKYYEVVFDRFSFNESSVINHYIDYKYYKLSGNRVQKLFIVNDLPLSLIKHEKNKGIVTLNPEEDAIFKIEVADAHGNIQTIEIPLKYSESVVKNIKEPTGKHIDYLKDYAFQNENVSVEWDARTFFEDVNLDLQLQKDKVVLHKDEFAVQKNISIKFLVDTDFPNKDKTFIGLKMGNKMKYYDTWKRENDFRIRTKELGTYELVTDLDPPTIQLLSAKNVFSQADEIVLEIEDQLSGIGSFNGYLNQEWILFDYDYKTKKIIHKLTDKKYKVGQNTLRVEVVDRVGNNTTFEQTIIIN